MTRTRARTSTSCTRSSASSIATCDGIDNGWDDEPPSSGSSASTRRRSRSRRRCPGAGGRHRLPASGDDRANLGVRARVTRRCRTPRLPTTAASTPSAHRPTTGTTRRAVVGRRRRAERPRARPAAGRGGGPDLHVRAAGRGRSRSSASPRSSSTSRSTRRSRPLSVRLTDVAPDGTVGPGERRGAEPDPSALARRPGAARARRRRGDPRRRCGPPAIGCCRATGSASRWRRRSGRSSGRRRTPPRSASTAGATAPSRLELPVVPPAGGPGDGPCRPSRPTADAATGHRRSPSTAPARRRRPTGLADRARTSSPARSRSTFHDGGEDIVPDGRRLYAAETLRMTAWDARPGPAELDADVVYRWQELEPARNGELTRIEIRADLASSEHRHRLRPVRPPRGRRRRRPLLRARLARAHPAPPGLSGAGGR